MSKKEKRNSLDHYRNQLRGRKTIIIIQGKNKMSSNKWGLENLPPKGHPEVGLFMNQLYEIAKTEKERLQVPARMLANYALYRGQHGNVGVTAKKVFTPVNLYFANIERTISNITAKDPTAEVVDMDGINDEAEKLVSARLKKWWKDTKQYENTRRSARAMEIYGISSIIKPHWNKTRKEPGMMLTDPFGFFPAPGNYENLDLECPYICYLHSAYVDSIERKYGVEGVESDDAYEILGKEREKYKPPVSYGRRESLGNYADPMTSINRGDQTEDTKLKRCVIVEMWIRDKKKETVKEMVSSIDEQGNEILQEVSKQVPFYPDGIRKISFVKAKSDSKENHNGFIVLDDTANPNINAKLVEEFPEMAAKTYPWGRLPEIHVNSYPDLISIWGFAAAEQVGDLIVKINQIFSRLVSYVIQVMTPPLIIQKHCGITKADIESALGKEGRLVLMPTTPKARIEFMQIPNLPATFFKVLELILQFFDRIYQIEDADRGIAPKGIIAASAIVALQERNRVLIQTKTLSVDKLAEERGKWAIGLWQNFGVKSELVKVNEEPAEFVGTNLVGRNFGYVVEAGSSTPRTSLHLQELAEKLYDQKAIGQRGYLEAINWPNWKEEIERTAESQLDQALQLLIDAGMPEEDAFAWRQWLMEPQGGPGDTKQSGGNGSSKSAVQTAKPGVPQAYRGKEPPEEVRGE